MKYKIIGLERFISKKGTDITKLHCIYQSDKVSGTAVESFFILSENVPSDVSIDTYFIPFFGPSGRNGFLAGLQITVK